MRCVGVFQVARVLVMQSVWLWLVAWLWRIFNPHALTAMLLGAIFVDKHWVRRRLLAVR